MNLSNYNPDFLNSTGYRNVVRMKGGYLNAVKMQGGFLNAVKMQGGRMLNAVAEDAPSSGEDLTGTAEYKKNIDQYGNAGDQANYYTSPAYKNYLLQVQRMTLAAAEAEAERMRQQVETAMQNAQDSEEKLREEMERARKEAEARLDAAKNFTILGVKVPKIAVYVVGAGALFLIARKFLKK